MFDHFQATVVAAIFIGAAIVVLYVLYEQYMGTRNGNKNSRDFAPFLDRYETIEAVQEALRKAGLESSQMIVAVDFTGSNKWTGAKSFGGACLHEISPERKNPYQEVIALIGRTLSAFDDDGIIPAYGFGDSRTTNKSVFSLGAGPCHGFEEVLSRYDQAATGVTLSGPTSFVPIIETAIQYVKEHKQYTILLIVADGQVNDVKETERAIVEASKYPLSIVVCGVGDGPFDLMAKWDDNLPTRKFDNLQFVDYTTIGKLQAQFKDATFALAALQEIPEQYKAVQRLGYI
jgi:E3 ubiquitin-protein ligase RGLG